MAVNNIPLAIGQRWKTRGGQEVEIVGYDEETDTEYVWDLYPEGSVTDEGYCLSAYSQSKNDLITLIQGEHGFIPWNGGECPVGDDVKIEYKMMSNPAKVLEGFPDCLRWAHKGLGGDIIAYRVVQQEVKPTKVDVEEEQTEQVAQPKYTVEQVFEALDKVAFIGELQSYMIAVKKTLNKIQDPEYNKYLELKAKFE